MIDQDVVNAEHADFRELIESTDNVHTVQEAKAFMQKLEQIDLEGFEEIEETIIENIDAGNIFDGAFSDEPVKNTFSEINKAYSYGVNEYLKTWRNY